MNLLRSSKSKTILFTVLYASEGAPIGFIWWALPTLLRTRGIEIDTITSLTSALVLPWIFKFIWAPLVDTYRSDKWGLKHWIIFSQLLMGFALLPVLLIDPMENFSIFAILLFCHAFFAATQDVSIDALAINYVPTEERGKINGYMQAGMLTGRSLFGGGTILLTDLLGWEFIIILMISFIWASLIFVIFVKEPPRIKKSSLKNFKINFSNAFKVQNTWTGIFFALISAAAFEATGALAGPYLVDKEVSQQVIGIFFGIFIVIAMVIGGIAGGKVSDRIGRIKSLKIFLSGVVLSVLSLALFEEVLPDRNINILIIHFTILYFFIGLFTSASYAFFMDITNPKLGGTQFSTYMAATNGCESWSTWAGGQLTVRGGYSAAFLVMSLVSLLSLFLLKLLKKEKV